MRFGRPWQCVGGVESTSQNNIPHDFSPIFSHRVSRSDDQFYFGVARRLGIFLARAHIHGDVGVHDDITVGVFNFHLHDHVARDAFAKVGSSALCRQVGFAFLEVLDIHRFRQPAHR